MSYKTEIIAFIVRTVANETGLVRKPDPMTYLFNTIFDVEPYDVRVAKQIEEKLDRGVKDLKKMNTRRKFNKIVSDI